jgi:GNAT superfamily N-acetyltransferase
MAGIQVREAKISDVPQILELVKGLAEFERAPEKVVNTEAKMREEGFGKNQAFKAFVAENEGNIIAFALTYYRYSTWKGKVLFLEDLFVQSEFRRKGIGKKLMETCLDLARKEKLPFLCLQVLEWNQEAIDFYKNYQAEFDAEWINVMIPVHNQ